MTLLPRSSFCTLTLVCPGKHKFTYLSIHLCICLFLCVSLSVWLLVYFVVVAVVFLAGFLCVALTDMELTLYTRLAMMSEIYLPLHPEERD